MKDRVNLPNTKDPVCGRSLRIPFEWPDRYPAFLEKFLYIPRLYERHASIEKWSLLFEKDQPVVIEYCSGNGQWIGKKAKENPHLNWVAVEKMFERAKKCWLVGQREGLSNLYVVCGDAITFTKFYAPIESVEEIYVNFPDPWPKWRHAKHRVVAAPFLRELLRIVKRGGRATFVTDDEPYVLFMLSELKKCPEWAQLDAPFDAQSYGSSFFAELWKKKGKEIHYLLFERVL
ncbi:MAG: hypothetical protein A3E80_03000 [Chlamydiae bacterium RIFCSPHIGHO2_12_FULL_49_9]|nr:MAG: hypothetical protein A3E80_03000 [Chlamydiae bacterium RIFCSPHIGHO2_12_FULL_49_9]